MRSVETRMRDLKGSCRRIDRDKDGHTMLSRGGTDATTSRRALPGTEEAIEAVVALANGNPDMMLVMKHVGQLVTEGLAAWEMRDSGETEVRFASGETFLLAETAILRLA